MKVKKIITIVVTVLAAGLVVMSGVMKLLHVAAVTDTLSKMGVLPFITVLGLMEIGFAILFLFPKTMKLGFILLSCYFAGALATELSHGDSLNALMPIVLVWISAFLRDDSIFLPVRGKSTVV